MPGIVFATYKAWRDRPTTGARSWLAYARKQMAALNVVCAVGK